jgi:hypothetical protein
MNHQPLFLRRSLALLTALSLALGLTLTGVASAGALLGKAGLPKTVAAAAVELPATTPVNVEQPVAAETVSQPPAAVTVEQPVVADNAGQPAAATTPSELEVFAASVVDGRANVLRGVYVPGVLALRVVQQAAGAYSVDLTPGRATQFSAASAYGVTGLLADNVASGVLFYSLSPGQEVTLIYGDGAQRRYQVDGISRYQALSPTDPYSDFVDLASGARLSATTLFSQMYSGGDKVTFQTCLAQDGIMAWGRLFVTAHRLP